MTLNERTFTTILKTTTHRGTYNRANKNLHAACPRCKWHRGCAEQGPKKMCYHGFIDGTLDRSNFISIYNWKLVSKNKKQWMKKRLKTYYCPQLDGRVYIEFSF